VDAILILKMQTLRGKDWILSMTSSPHSKTSVSPVHTNTINLHFQNLHSGERSRKPPFSVIENAVYVWTEGYNGEKFSVFEISGYVWTGPPETYPLRVININLAIFFAYHFMSKIRKYETISIVAGR